VIEGRDAAAIIGRHSTLMNEITGLLKLQFEASFGMLADEIEACPDSLWLEKAGGFPFWQQILHALHGAAYWLRPEGEEFSEPFPWRKLYPEFDGEAEGPASKEELLSFAREVESRARRLFFLLRDEELPRPSWIEPSMSVFDVVAGQLRHLMYHAGHCDSILRERELATPPWREVGLS
jgi:hypothetical protein